MDALRMTSLSTQTERSFAAWLARGTVTTATLSTDIRIIPVVMSSGVHGAAGRSSRAGASIANGPLMTPPLCVWCEAQPVNRTYGAEPPSARGVRMVNGKRWRWCCSPACSAQDRMANGAGYANALKAGTVSTRKARERVLRRLIEACKPHLDERGRVDPKHLVKAVMYELRMAGQRQRFRRRYHEGFAA